MPSQDLQIPEWTPSPPANADLGPEDVHLWRVPVDAGRTPGLITRSATLLSPDERERADRYKFPADAGRFILCRAALRILLGRYTNAAPQTISISCGPFGKPMLTGSSDSPDRPSPEFNVSHSGSYALLGFSRDHPLGLDLENDDWIDTWITVEPVAGGSDVTVVMGAGGMPDSALGRISLVCNPDVGLHIFKPIILDDLFGVTYNLENHKVSCMTEDESAFLAECSVELRVEIKSVLIDEFVFDNP